MSQLTNTIDFKKYKRFFSFGCSFTEYFWPTWADIISWEIPENYNYGKCGGGNGFIFHSIIEANQRFKFCPTDLVIVFWTNIAREDRYINKRWMVVGNIYTQNFYSPEVVKQIADDRGYLIRDLGYITATKYILDNCGCDYDYLTMVPINQPDSYSNSKINDTDVTDLYSSITQTLKPSIFEKVFNFKWHSLPKLKSKFWENFDVSNDYHPTPEQYYTYLTTVYPQIKFSDSTIDNLKKESGILESLPHVSQQNYKFNRSIGPRL